MDFNFLLDMGRLIATCAGALNLVVWRAAAQRSSKRVATIMNLIQLARRNGHDPHAYLKDVFADFRLGEKENIGILSRYLEEGYNLNDFVTSYANSFHSRIITKSR